MKKRHEKMRNVEDTHYTKYLGFTFSAKLKWDMDISKMSSKVNKNALPPFEKLQVLSAKHKKKAAYKSFMHPNVE